MRISDWSSDVCSADRSKATVKVRVGFKTRDARILPEMGARVSFLAEASDDKTQSGAAPSGVSLDRKSVVSGKSVSVRLVLGGRRIIKKKKTRRTSTDMNTSI